MSTKFDDYSCADDCERLAEIEGERDTWARAAEVLVKTGFPHWLFGPLSQEEEERACVGWLHAERIAAAYAIAEAYGDNWRLELEAKPLEDI